MVNVQVYGAGTHSVGKFKASFNGKHTLIYTLWKNMLARCYSKVMHSHRPTYVGCRVEGSFLDFQKFAEWYSSQIQCENIEYQLDKDLLVKGNKVYSENFCLIVPRKINMFLCKSEAARGKYKIGVHYNTKYKMFVAQSSNSGVKTSDCFHTEDQAFQHYKMTKENIARSLAEQFKDKCDSRVISALNCYKVSAND